MLRPAADSLHCRKNRKISIYLQQPSPLRQLLQRATSVNIALVKSNNRLLWNSSLVERPA